MTNTANITTQNYSPTGMRVFNNGRFIGTVQKEGNAWVARGTGDMDYPTTFTSQHHAVMDLL